MKQFLHNTIQKINSKLSMWGFTPHHFTYTYVKSGAGFTLVETLVAITVLLVAIVGPMTIAAQGLQASFFAREETTAVYLAQEGIEAVERARDNGALDAIYGIGLTAWGLCQNGLLPASTTDPYADQKTPNGKNYTDKDVCSIDTWSWYGDSSIVPTACKKDNNNPDYYGCDVDTDTGPGSATFHSCTNDKSACNLRMDPTSTSTTGLYYQYQKGVPSRYTRIITLETEPENSDEIRVTVEVKWRASIFGGTPSKVILQTRLLNQYDEYPTS
jgi:type II secretory pathway pseudopilin PulG